MMMGRIRYRVTTILAVTVLAAVALWLCGPFSEPTSTIEQLKGTVLFEGEFEFYRSGDIVTGVSEPTSKWVGGISFGRNSTISDKDLDVLFHFPRLRLLSLSSTSVTDSGVLRLAGLRKLEFLSLSNTNVTDEGLMHLAPLQSLRVLVVTGSRMTGGGIKKFREMRPNVVVVEHITGPGNARAAFFRNGLEEPEERHPAAQGHYHTGACRGPACERHVRRAQPVC